MGYILPLPHFQYRDYHSRVVQDKQDPFFIEKLYKAELNIQAKNEEQKAGMGINKDHGKKELFTPESVHKSVGSEKIYADVTGKGRYFSEST